MRRAGFAETRLPLFMREIVITLKARLAVLSSASRFPGSYQLIISLARVTYFWT